MRFNGKDRNGIFFNFNLKYCDLFYKNLHYITFIFIELKTLHRSSSFSSMHTTTVFKALFFFNFFSPPHSLKEGKKILTVLNKNRKLTHNMICLSTFVSFCVWKLLENKEKSSLTYFTLSGWTFFYSVI